jgi:5'(3')-deoxyribonucleotidase
MDHGPIIGVDCDGVLASGIELWQALYAAYPEHIPGAYEALTCYDWPRITPETTQLCLHLSADPEFTRRLAAMPGMAWALRTLYRHGWRIHIITARPPEVRRATYEWLCIQGVDRYVETVHCTEDKLTLAWNLHCRAFVEDNHRTAELIGAQGLRSYLLDATYNRLPSVYSRRMLSWREIVSDLMLAQRHAPDRQAPEMPAIPAHTPGQRGTAVPLMATPGVA